MASRWFPGVRQLPRTLLLALALSVPSLVYADGHEGKSAADYFVHSLPGAPDGPLVKMHAGHVEITPEHNGNLFFWHFANAHIAERQRTVIWLNGGPGCSSEDGALMEIGPYRLKDDHTLRYNNGSWHEFANLLFVDNPVGTGFSYVNTDSYVHDLEEMATQFIAFLEKWYAIFPEYEHDDIYIAGESYAGQHIPYIAKAILERNKKSGNPHGPWNLKGLLIGNGWISPPEQYDSYIKFAYEKGLIQKGSQTAADLEAQYRICTKELAVSPDKVDLTSCERVLTDLLDKTAVTNPETHKTECYNMYDVRLHDTHPSCGMNWPPDLTSVTPYLRLKEVTQALHVSPGKSTGWTECSGGVGQAFRAKKSTPSIRLLPDLLKEVPILLFSGAEDLICNHIGTEALISNMQWNGGKGFEVSPGNWAPRRDWIFEGENAGFWQEARNLTYVLFNNASHMVPFDWPRRSRDMLDRFIGVDVTKLGRLPTESTLDGAAGPTTGNGTTQSAVDVGEAKSQIEKAKWDAYRRSGEIVLVIVAVAAVSWGIFVWRERKKRAGPDYQALSTGDTGGGRHGRRGANGNGALENFRQKRNGHGQDLEAGDFDESELDDLHVESAGPNEPRYSIGGDSDAGEDSKNEKKPANPKGSRSLT